MKVKIKPERSSLPDRQSSNSRPSGATGCTCARGVSAFGHTGSEYKTRGAPPYDFRFDVPLQTAMPLKSARPIPKPERIRARNSPGAVHQICRVDRTGREHLRCGKSHPGGEASGPGSHSGRQGSLTSYSGEGSATSKPARGTTGSRSRRGSRDSKPRRAAQGRQRRSSPRCR